MFNKVFYVMGKALSGELSCAYDRSYLLKFFYVCSANIDNIIQFHCFWQGLSYDLGDCTKWEYMFPNTDKPLLQIPEAEDDIMDGLEDEEVKWFYCSIHITRNRVSL